MIEYVPGKGIEIGKNGKIFKHMKEAMDEIKWKEVNTSVMVVLLDDGTLGMYIAGSVNGELVKALDNVGEYVESILRGEEDE